MSITRREVMSLAGLLPIFPLGGCIAVPPAPLVGDSIDAHCHLFNASDLTIVRFLREVVLHLPQDPLELRVSEVHDPDGIDVVLAALLNIAGAGRAPSAAAEIEVLEGREKSKPKHANFSIARELTEESVAAFVYENGSGAAVATRRFRIKANVRDDIYRTLVTAAGPDINRTAHMTRIKARQIARASLSIGDIKALFDWITLFTLYRSALAQRLAEDQKHQGRRPVLLTPAMVDYDLWLGETPTSTLDDQMRVMSLISRRYAAKSTGALPVVHGYFPFDPLRQVVHERQQLKTASPLDLAREALEDFGFIGIKLYPPMGFRPTENLGPYPERVKRLVQNPSAVLNAALDRLYKMCADIDAPILTHAYPSNAPFDKLAERADPHYWLPVFGQYPTLRVCLAHFGGFDKVSEPNGHRTFPEDRIEWVVGRHLKDNPETRVVADLSFLSEILDKDEDEKARLGKLLKRYLKDFDRNVEHLLFGTDWTMLGRLKEYSTYVQTLEAYLKVHCGFGDAEMQRFFSGNAIRFLGLDANGKTRARLSRYYRKHGLDETRLPSDGGNALAGLFR